MGEDVVRQFQTDGLQHGRPVHRVRGQDVLADQVMAGRPVAAGFDFRHLAVHRHVVDQRVEPDVGDVLVVEGQGHAPGKAFLGARDAQVAQRLFQESQDFVFARLRPHESWIRIDVFDQPILVLAHFEKVIGLADLPDRAAAFRAVAFLQILFGEEAFAGRAVPALVGVAVDFTAIEEVLQDFLHHTRVPFFRRADEVGIGNIEPRPQFLEADVEFVHVLLGGNATLAGGLLHLLSVLVRAGEEEHFLPFQAMVTRGHIGGDGGVGVADVRHIVDVVNRGGDVKTLGHGVGFRGKIQDGDLSGFLFLSGMLLSSSR